LNKKIEKGKLKKTNNSDTQGCYNSAVKKEKKNT